MARKINTRFIALLCIAGALLVGAVVGIIFGRDLLRPSITALEKRGDDALAAGDFELARDVFGKAASRAKTDIDLQIKFVDAFDYCVNGDIESARQLRKYYADIFQLDPRNLKIMQRILKFQLSEARGQPGQRPSIRALIETADRILQQDPADRDARKAKVTAVLEPYQRHLEVTPEELAGARELAQKLYDEKPDDPEAIMMNLRFSLEECRDHASKSDIAELDKSLEKLKSFADTAMQKTPENAAACFASQLAYRALAYMTPKLAQEQRVEHVKQAEAFLQKADTLANPQAFDNADYFLMIRSATIKSLEQRDYKSAEARYAALLQEAPDTRQPRLMLAQYLAKNPQRRAEAAAILEAPWSPHKPLSALDSIEQRGLEIQEQLRLCTILLGSIEQTDSSQDREKPLKRVEEIYAHLAALPNLGGGMSPWMRRIQGGIALQHGNVSEAIDQLDAALKLLPPDSQNTSEIEIRNEVLAEYAGAHMRLGQTGKARPALMELVTRDPVNILARINLIDVLISERRFDDALKQVELLKRLLPNSPIVSDREMRCYAGREDVLRDKYKDLPETTRDQRAIKIQTAGMLSDLAEVTRLSRLMVSSDPADADAAVILANALLRQNQRDEALVVLDAASKLKPDNTRLKAFRDSIVAETPEERKVLLEEQIEKIVDPYTRELTRAEVQRAQGKPDEALATLKKAEAIDPKDARALDAQLVILVAQKKFAEAEALLDRIATLNTDEAGDQVKRIRLMAARAYEETSPLNRQNLLDEALMKASQISQKYPEIAGPSLLYAQLLQNAGNYADAVEQYAQTLDKAPTNIDALRGSVQCLMAMDRAPEARRRLEEARRLAPNDAGLRNLELDLALNYGDPLRAIDTLTDVLKQNADNPQAWSQLGVALEKVSADRTRKGETTAARQFMQRAADHWAKTMEKFPADLRFASAYADAQRRLGNNAEAEQAIEKLVSRPDWADKPEAIELLATQYERSGKPQAAEQSLRGVLDRVKPAPTSTLLRLAMLYVQQQRMPEALRVLDLKKDDPDVRRQRIELLIAANDLTAARQAIEEALAKEPTPDIYLIAGFVELRSGQFEKADGFIAKVLQSRPNDAAALFYRAQIRLNSTPPNADGAREDLQKVITISSGNIEARLTLSDLYLRKGQRDLAVREIEKAWEANRGAKVVLLRLLDAYSSATPPRTIDAQRVLDQARESPQLAGDPDVILAEASISLSRNDPRKARELARQALAVSPDNTGLQQRYFDLLLRAGAGRDLIKESEAVLQKDRSAWWLYRLRGQAYNRLEQKTEAGKEFDAAYNLVTASGNEQAISTIVRTIAQELGYSEAIKRIEPLARTDISAKLLLATLYQSMNNPDQSLELLERVQADRDRLRPDQLSSLLQLLGTVYLQVTPTAPQKALQAYEELYKRTPNDMLLLNNLAYVNTLPGSGGDMKKALEYSSRAYEMTQKLSSAQESVLYVWDTHGWVLVKNGKIFEGLDLLRQAADQAKFPDVFLHLAEAYIINNDFDRAESALQSAETLIDGIVKTKQSLDPMIRPKLEQLSADLKEKRRAAIGAAQ